MSLLLAYDETGLDHPVQRALDDILAPLQTWAGKQEGAGKWVDVTLTSDDLFPEIAGDTWVVGTTRQYAYTIIGDTITLSWYLTTSLTVASTAQALYLRIPDGFRANPDRFSSNTCWFINGGTYGTAFVRAGYSGTQSERYIRFTKLNTAAPDFVTDASFFIAGQLTFEIVR